MLRFDGFGASDSGPVRAVNEDAGYLSSQLVLVADGVGGAPAGEIASATAAYLLAQARLSGIDPMLALDTALRRAVDVLTATEAEDAEVGGMATTLTAIAVEGERAALLHAGDSRAYLLRDGGLVRLTRDHTWVQQLIDDGLLEPAAALAHPWRHVVTRSVHAGPLADEERAELLELALAPGDRLMLCTDGVTDRLDDERIAALLVVPRAADSARALLDEALLAGAQDNLTCVVADVVHGSGAPRPRTPGQGLRLGSLAEDSNLLAATRLTAS